MVYSDSRTAIKWVKDKSVKTKLPRNDNTELLFDLLDRAVRWLQNNDYQNLVVKWETKKWGEIPADFGRK
jgi:ribonuclease HI